MTNQSLQQEWNKFAKEIIPKNAPKIQVQETRRAFYYGASSAFNLITNLWENVGEGREITDEEATEALLKIQEELKQFFLKFGKEF